MLSLLETQREDFNPRSPRGGATLDSIIRVDGSISIHAPHEGERLGRREADAQAGEFQSTLPTRGSDDMAAQILTQTIIFQSTLPTRGSDKKARMP